MSRLDLPLDPNQAIGRLLRFLAVEGVTGHEAAIGREVIRDLIEVGVPRKAIRFDTANERIPLPTETGNLIVTLAGTRPGPRRMFMTHLDTVPLCAGARPVRKGDRIVAAGPTALGGDNRTGCACLATLAATLLQHQLPHPPLTLLFTVREESGLYGARFLDLAELGEPAECYNVDGRSASEITIGAVGADRWEVEITGRAAHAGVHPEQGISASMVAALALAEVFQGGWWGKIQKNGREGTSNVGSISGHDGGSAGEATNVITDFVRIRGESRSHSIPFINAITRTYREAFQAAARKVKDHRGRIAKCRFQGGREYFPFKLPSASPVVQHALTAGRHLGLNPTLRVGNGGLDANWLVRHGVPTITFGAGQNEIHTVDEYVAVKEFHLSCRLALVLATQPWN